MPFFEGSIMAEKENQEIQNPRQNNKTNRERREKEEKQIAILQRTSTIIIGVIILLMVAALITWIIVNPNRRTVAKVGDQPITVNEFQQAVRLQRSNLNSNYQYMEQLYAMFGMPVDESTRESYAMQMSDAYKGLMGQGVLSNMIDQRVMAYGAAQEGITVSDAEVEAYYKGLFGYYPDGTPTSAPTAEPFEATPTVTDEQLAILRYTETPLPTEIPAAEEEIEAIVSEAEEVVAQAEEIVTEAADQVEEAVSEATENVEEAAKQAAEETANVVEEILSEPTEAPTSEPTIAPTPTEYTQDMFKQYESVYFANNFSYSKEFFKDQLRYELLQDKVEEKLKGNVSRTADMVWARHILVETEDEAKDVLARINAGEEWGDLAAEVSLDSTADNGGDLGWFTEGVMVAPFNDAAFSQEVGTISDPVETDYGWHLIQVIAHEEHPLTSSEFDTAVSTAYQEWLDSYSAQLDITMTDDIAPWWPEAGDSAL